MCFCSSRSLTFSAIILIDLEPQPGNFFALLLGEKSQAVFFILFKYEINVQPEVIDNVGTIGQHQQWETTVS